MDYKAIEGLIKTLSESNLTTLEIESDGMRIKMCKEEKVIVNNYQQQDKIHDIDKKSNNLVVENNDNKTMKNEVAKEEVNDAVQNIKKDVIEDNKNIEIIKSPIVGTFYESPGPEEDLFVKMGSIVKAGDTLCIIEAMKLMNEITSEVNGEIVEILVENEEMVEYGQPIFKIRKQ
jgi:acetyl-CoA carboxylase biotin carboxyl carrier protein